MRLRNWRTGRPNGAAHEIVRRLAACAISLLWVPVGSAQQGRETPAEPQRVHNWVERRIIVSIPDRKLAIVVAGQVLKVYPIAVGAPGTPTPSGEYKVVNRLTDPTYYKPGLVVPPGQANPLGRRWVGLSLKGLGIHGTNDPSSIGSAASGGCIRMHNEDAEELFELVRVGDVVELHNQPSPLLAAIFGTPPAVEPKEASQHVAAVATVVTPH